MAKYRYVHIEIWDDPDFQGYPPDAKLVFIYLFTNYKVGESGLYVITPRTISNDTGVSEERVGELLENGLKNVMYDESNSVVFLTRYRIHNGYGGNPDNIAKAIARERERILSPLWKEFDKRYTTVGKPLGNGSLDIDTGIGLGHRDREKPLLTEHQNEALKIWLTVPCKTKPKRNLIAEQLITLESEDEFQAVDFVSLAKTCRAWYEGEGKKCGNLSLAMRNFARKAVEFGRDLRMSVDGIATDLEPENDEKVPWPKPPPVPTDDDKDLWRSILAALRETVEVKDFETWLQPTRVAGRTNGEVWVEVPNWFYADFINENYLEAIRAALVGAGMPESVKVYVGTG